MTKRSQWVLTGMAVVALLIGITLISHRNSPAPSSEADNKEKKRIDQKQEFVRKTAPESSPSKAAPLSTPSKPQAKEQWMSGALAVLNHVPINFYGKVLDQYGAPIPGVRVAGGVKVAQSWMQDDWTNYYTQTDADGLFSFTNYKGESFAIGLSKDGYVFQSKNTLFRYSAMWQEKDRHKPDPKNPVVFTMWKLKGPEPMNHSDGDYNIDLDGSPLVIDLVEHRVNKTRGDLVVKVSRDPLEMPDKTQHYSWQVTLEAVDGGLIEYNPATTSYPNEAPADGYQPSLTYTMKGDADKWESNLQKQFFFTTRNGKLYGRFSIRTFLNTTFLKAKSSESMVRFDLYVNPNGSRNLEYDRAKDIRNPLPPSAGK